MSTGKPTPAAHHLPLKGIAMDVQDARQHQQTIRVDATHAEAARSSPAIWPFSSISTVASVMRHRPARGRVRSAAHRMRLRRSHDPDRLWTKSVFIACPDSSFAILAAASRRGLWVLAIQDDILDDSFPRRGLIHIIHELGHCHITVGQRLYGSSCA